jgi:hypothetical protein
MVLNQDPFKHDDENITREEKSIKKREWKLEKKWTNNLSKKKLQTKTRTSKPLNKHWRSEENQSWLNLLENLKTLDNMVWNCKKCDKILDANKHDTYYDVHSKLILVNNMNVG